MHIKQLTVHGFKSYRDETVFGPFSPHHNVIVGRNGSGKSNFFAAIRFVLHDAYTKLGQEERQALLHEGGAGHLSAYVEIVFDNADGRFPNNKDTMTIRRTVGLKKDEYSVDGKTSSKSDVLNLLQTAGFSKSNPYYIVPQGRVTALTNAKDEERLALLKEVAGTRTYEEHRQESLKILEETTSKREKIRELLVFIDERLVELEEERTELCGYQQREKERRTLEYILQHRELVQVGEEIARLEGENGELVGNNAKTLEEFDGLMGQIACFEADLVKLREKLVQSEEQLRADEEEHKAVVQEQTRVKLHLDELAAKRQRYSAEESAHQSQLEKVNGDISFKEDALAAVYPRLREAEATQRTNQDEIGRLEGRRDVLLAKQGRSAQFRSAAERDRWIRKEVEAIEGTVELHTKQVASLSEEVESAQLRKNDMTELVARLAEGDSNLMQDLSSLDAQLYDLRKQRDHLTEERKTNWRAENKLESMLGTLRDEAARCERALIGTADRGTMQGIEAVRRIASAQQIAGVHGPLFELFEVDAVYRTAAEVVAGNSLFHVVVDDEHVAGRLLEALIREKAGRVTFMPLNRLRPSAVAYPVDREEATPLLPQLRYDTRFEPAMRQVFGKTVICRDLAKGAAIARQAGLSAITLGGDRADRKGALSGGYIDNANGRLELASKWKAAREKVVEYETTLASVRRNLKNLEPEITRTLGELEAVECRRRELCEGKGTSELELRRRELAALVDLIAGKEKTKRALEGQMSLLTAQMASMRSELGTTLTSKLSLEEQAELTATMKAAEEARQLLYRLAGEITKMATNVTEWETELDVSLRRRRHELMLRLGEVSTRALERDLHRAQAEYGALEERAKACEAEVDKLGKVLQNGASDQTNLQSALDRARTQYDEAMRGQTHQSASMERYLVKRMALLERRETLQRRIRELAIAPDAEYDTLKDASGSELLRRLHTANEELRTRYAHVNKKAHEQHASFHRQGDALRERQQELEASARAIDDFVAVLDRRKDEAIERTFQQVSKGFSKVFEQLVPAGRGELIMVRQGLGEENTDASNVSTGASSSGKGNAMEVDVSGKSSGGAGGPLEFAGIAICVSFNSKSDEGLLMSQLSGGQKSLVALALIFAIQRCDPAPFYLFDEIDANLDAAYRTSVANLIAEMKGNAQFLTTTFRPELLEGAESFFGVSFGGRVSRVESITREQALQFVELDPLAPK